MATLQIKPKERQHRQLMPPVKLTSQGTAKFPSQVAQEARRKLAEGSLYHFMRQGWRYVDPSSFVPGWHLQTICEHLEAVTRGDIKRLLINIPPRCGKSLTVCVFWFCWSWIHKPETKWMFATYGQELSNRDSVSCRELINSPWYERNWGDVFSLRPDQNQKSRFDNNHHGFRLATSVGGRMLGEGGDFLVSDDPHNALEAESEAERASVIEWSKGFATRKNSPRTAMVCVMQRLHEEDLSGRYLEQGNWEHLCLPMRYESDRACVTSLGPVDPRSEDGELLCWPRYGDTPDQAEKEIATLESDLGPYGTAGQLQQRPAPREGGLFKRQWFRSVPVPPSRIKRAVRYWDKAATVDDGCYSVGVLMAEGIDGLWYVVHVVRGRWSAHERNDVIKQTAEQDQKRWKHKSVKTWVEQEPGSGGKESAEWTIKQLSGFPVGADRPVGPKETRAEPFADQAEGGNVRIVGADWNADYLDELTLFPKGKHKDQVDASSGAFAKLAKPRKRMIAGVR